MQKKMVFGVSLLLAAGCVVACSSKGNSNHGSTGDSSVSGKLTSVTVSSLDRVGILTAKTITHVVAVSPSTSNSTRKVAAVDANGSFSLSLDSGKPYLIVFVAQDGVLTGPNMIVGIVRVAANQLDTLPIAQAAAVDLGDVSVNSSTATATPSTNVSTLLATLGVTSAEASYIGGIDDLALRLANPDIDGNGVIDALEDKSFGLDWHIRATAQKSGTNLTIADVTNTFADPSTLTLVWGGGSAYAMYPASFAANNFVVSSGTSTALQNGGAFTSAGTSVNATSYSDGFCGSTCSWGPDYNMSSQELGASDAAATFVYTLGSPSKQLTYSNVRTKLKSALNADGTLLPFVKVNVAGSYITGISYKWMKKSGSTWIDATTKEVALVVQPGGGYLTLYTFRGPGDQRGLSFVIPRSSQTGTINIGDEGTSHQGVSSPSTVSISDVCNTALSYDDEMGLRIFAGSFAPTATLCN